MIAKILKAVVRCFDKIKKSTTFASGKGRSVIMDNIRWNKCQTPLKDLSVIVDKNTPDEKVIVFKDCPQEVQEQFWDFINNVPFIRWMVSSNRPLISELPRDEYGRALIDVTKPPILEGSDYFRQAAIEWQNSPKHQYTSLHPNANPNSEFGRYIREERQRGWDGYVNPETYEMYKDQLVIIDGKEYIFDSSSYVAKQGFHTINSIPYKFFKINRFNAVTIIK